MVKHKNRRNFLKAAGLGIALDENKLEKYKV